jgi:hypothetical protein
MRFFQRAQEVVGLKPLRDDISQQQQQQESLDDSVFGTICPKLTYQQVSEFFVCPWNLCPPFTTLFVE